MSNFLAQTAGTAADEAKGFWHLGLTTNFSVVGNTASDGESNQNLIPFDNDFGSLDVTADLTSGNHKIIITSPGNYRIYFNANELSQSYYKFYHLYVDGVERRAYHCAGYETVNNSQSAGFWCEIYLHENAEVQLKTSKSTNAMTLIAADTPAAGALGDFTKTRFIGIQVDSEGKNKNIKSLFHGASSADISLTVNTLTKVTNLYEVIPSFGSTFDNSAQKFTVTENGTYLVGQVQSHAAGYYRYGVLYKNGSEVFRGHIKSYSTALTSNSSYLHEISLVSGDELEFYYIQTSGSTHTIYMRGKGQTAVGRLCPAACYGIRIGD